MADFVFRFVCFTFFRMIQIIRREEELLASNVKKHAAIYTISRRAMHFRDRLRNLASAWVLFTNSTRKSKSSEELIEINSIYEFIN